jgi:uncharacterized protein YyaL (SSP411 family)
MSFEETERSMKERPLPILVDVYTSWCGWCKVMDKKTYANDSVAGYINRNYYAIKFDAESKTPVQWKGKTYTYEPQYKMHGLAIELLKGEASFPTTVFIPVQPSDPQPVPGYLPPKDIHTLLTYFSGGHYNRVRFDKYAEKFKSNW